MSPLVGQTTDTSQEPHVDLRSAALCGSGILRLEQFPDGMGIALPAADPDYVKKLSPLIRAVSKLKRLNDRLHTVVAKWFDDSDRIANMVANQLSEDDLRALSRTLTEIVRRLGHTLTAEFVPNDHGERLRAQASGDEVECASSAAVYIPGKTPEQDRLLIKEAAVAGLDPKTRNHIVAGLLTWGLLQQRTYHGKSGRWPKLIGVGINTLRRLGIKTGEQPEDLALRFVGYKLYQTLHTQIQLHLRVPPVSKEEIARLLRDSHRRTPPHLKAVHRAYEFAKTECIGLYYESGVDRFSHATRVARSLASMGASGELIAAALLSGVPSDRCDGIESLFAKQESGRKKEKALRQGRRVMATINALEELSQDLVLMGRPTERDVPFFPLIDEQEYLLQRIERIGETHKCSFSGRTWHVSPSDLLMLHLSNTLEETRTDSPELPKHYLKDLYHQISMREARIAERFGLTEMAERLLTESFHSAFPERYNRAVISMNMRTGLTSRQRQELLARGTEALHRHLVEDLKFPEDSFKVEADLKKPESVRAKKIDPVKHPRSPNQELDLLKVETANGSDSRKIYDLSKQYDLIRYRVRFFENGEMNAADRLALTSVGVHNRLGERHPERQPSRVLGKEKKLEWHRQVIQIEHPIRQNDTVDIELQLITERHHHHVTNVGGVVEGHEDHATYKTRRAGTVYLWSLGDDHRYGSVKLPHDEISLMTKFLTPKAKPIPPSQSLPGKIRAHREHTRDSIYIKSPMNFGRPIEAQVSFFAYRLPRGAVALDALRHPLIDLDPSEWEAVRLNLCSIGKGNRIPDDRGGSRPLRPNERLRKGENIAFRKKRRASSVETPEQLRERLRGSGAGHEVVRSLRAKLDLYPTDQTHEIAGEQMLRMRFGTQRWNATKRDILLPLARWLGLKDESELYRVVGTDNPAIHVPLKDIDTWYSKRFVQAKITVDEDRLSIEIDQPYRRALADLTKFTGEEGLRMVAWDIAPIQDGKAQFGLKFSHEGEGSLREKLVRYKDRVKGIHRSRSANAPIPYGHRRKIEMKLNARAGSAHELARQLAKQGFEIIRGEANESPREWADGEHYDTVIIETSGPDSPKSPENDYDPQEKSQKLLQILSSIKLPPSVDNGRHHEKPLVKNPRILEDHNPVVADPPPHLLRDTDWPGSYASRTLEAETPREIL